MGEAKKRELAVRQQVVEALGLQTAGGQIKVRWDENGQATAQGQKAFDEGLIVTLPEKNLLPVIATGHHVIEQSLGMDSRMTRHRPYLSEVSAGSINPAAT